MVDFDDPKFKYILALISIINFFVSILIEKKIIPLIITYWNRYKALKAKENFKNRQKSFNLNEIYRIKQYRNY
jgi:hypothetical protein